MHACIGFVLLVVGLLWVMLPSWVGWIELSGFGLRCGLFGIGWAGNLVC